MKLRSDDDRLNFLADVGRLDLYESEDELTDDLFEAFIQRRRPLVRRLVNFRRGQLSKENWRHNRFSILKGIRKWHTSVRGKRFHRALGRFNATRIFRDKLPKLGTHWESLDPLQDQALKAISSIRTHLYIDMGYYQSVEEEADLFQLLEYAIPLLNDIEVKLFNDSDAELSEDEEEILLRLLDQREFCKSIAEVLEVDQEKIIDCYQAVTANLLKQKDVSKDDTYFLTKVVEQLIPSALRLVEK